jgi:hypothetical protein
MQRIGIPVFRNGYAGLLLLLAVTGTHGLAQDEPRLNDFEAVLPHVVKGTLGGQQIETVILLSNPIWRDGPTISVELKSTDSALLPNQTIELSPTETRMISLKGGASVSAGAVIVTADQPIPVSAQIVIGAEPAAAVNVAVPGQRLISRTAIPVFRKAGEQPTMADDTGIAIYFDKGGKHELLLFDENGEMVGRANEFQQGQRMAAFLGEIFSTIPAGFTRGTLVIDSEWARAFSVTALYVKEAKIWTAEVTPIDKQCYYHLYLQPGADYDSLKTRYKFGEAGLAPGRWTIVATDEVARALERDPSVLRVEPWTSPFSL